MKRPLPEKHRCDRFHGTFSKCCFGWRFPDPKEQRTNESKGKMLVILGGGIMSDKHEVAVCELS